MPSTKIKIASAMMLIIGVGSTLIIQTHRKMEFQTANLSLQKQLEVLSQENRRLAALTNPAKKSYRARAEETKRLLLEGIPDAIQAVLKKPLGQRVAGFEGIVAAVDPVDLSKVVAILDNFPNYEAKTKLRSLFLSRWAEIDPTAAIAAAKATSGAENRRDAMLAVANGWAQTDLNSAVSWVKNLPGNETRNTMLQSIVATLAESDPQKAGAMALELPGRFQIFAVQKVAEKWGQADPDGTMTWVRSLPAGGAQTRALTSVSKALAESNPQSAADLVDLLPRANRAQFLDNIARSWAENDLSTAIAWAQGLEGHDQEIALRRVCEQWSQTDPKAAATFIQGNQPTLLYPVGVSWGASDSTAALAWANEIADKKTREEMYDAVVSGWAKTAPADAAHFVANLPVGDLQNSAAKAVASRWAENDPATAAIWAFSFPEGDTRQVAFQNIVLEWGKSDPGAVAVWLNALPAGNSRDTAVVTFANDCLKNYNPSAALAWARTITNEGVRNNLMRAIETSRQ